MPEVELDELVAFVAGQQADPARRIAYVGVDTDDIRAELEGISPPWGTTVVVERTEGRISAAVLSEQDAELGRAWILGPWVEGEWSPTAERLLDDALAALPAGIAQHELSGEVVNQRLADLAAARGWNPTEANHVLVADAATIARWPDPDVALRPVSEADLAWLAPLHDGEFPGTFATAAQLVTGSRTVLVADGGYVAGEVHDDGEGFIDFLVVAPAARRAGLGRQLVVALARQLVEQAPKRQVALTVQDHRTPARALYERLGFRSEGAIVGYRSWT